MTLFDLPPFVVLTTLFLLGALLGRGLNLCIERIPLHEECLASLKAVWHPGPGASARFRLRGNWPLVGWLQRSNRRAGRPNRYLTVELLNAILLPVLYACEIPLAENATIQESCLANLYSPAGWADSFWMSPAAVLHWRYLYHLVLIEALMVATFIDWDLTIIPDGVTFPATIVGVLGGFLSGQVYILPLWFQSPELIHLLRPMFTIWMHPLLDGPALPAWFANWPHIHGLLVSLTGLVVGAGMVWTVRIIGQWILRQEAMGFGDVILMGMMGSFLGWQPTAIVFCLAPVCALAVVAVSLFFTRSREIPYGPYLSLAAVVVLLAFPTVWYHAERLFSLGALLILLALVLVILLVVCLGLMQLVKLGLGIPLYYDEWIGEWTSADQLTHFAGEKTDLSQGCWRKETWPGVLSGRGQSYDENWRGGRGGGKRFPGLGPRE